MNEHSKRVRCRVELKKIKFISTNGHVTFCLLYKHTNDDIFDDFPEISDHFAKITKDFRGGTDDVSIIQQHKYFLRDYVTIAGLKVNDICN